MTAGDSESDHILVLWPGIRVAPSSHTRRSVSNAWRVYSMDLHMSTTTIYPWLLAGAKSQTARHLWISLYVFACLMSQI